MIHPYVYAGISQKKKSLLTDDIIIEAVCKKMHLTKENLFVKRRYKDLALARQMCFLVMIKLIPHKTLASIGRLFGQHHTTVIYGLERIRAIIDTEPKYKNMYESILFELQNDIRYFKPIFQQ